MRLDKVPKRGRLRPVARIAGWTLLSLVGDVLGLVRLHRVAVSFFGWAARIQPEQRAVFLAERGMSWAHLQRREEAVRDVNEAIRLAPGNPFFLLYMAWVYEELSSANDAITFYERAVEAPSEEFGETMRQSIRSRIDSLRAKYS